MLMSFTDGRIFLRNSAAGNSRVEEGREGIVGFKFVGDADVIDWREIFSYALEAALQNHVTSAVEKAEVVWLSDPVTWLPLAG